MLAAGTTLGPFKIPVPPGADGMGAGYWARDQRRAREIASQAVRSAVDPPVEGDSAWTRCDESQLTLHFRTSTPDSPSTPVPCPPQPVRSYDDQVFVAKAVDNHGTFSPPVSVLDTLCLCRAKELRLRAARDWPDGRPVWFRSWGSAHGQVDWTSAPIGHSSAPNRSSSPIGTWLSSAPPGAPIRGPGPVRAVLATATTSSPQQGRE